MLQATSQLEARLYRSYWGDGLLDIFCGVALLLVGLGWWLDEPVLAAVAPALLVPLFAPVRRALVEPRAGYVEFSRARQELTRTGLKATVVLGAGTLLLGVGVYFYVAQTDVPAVTPVISSAIAGLPALLLAVGAVIVGQITAAHRFRRYALVLIVAALATVASGSGPDMSMLGSGTAIALSGLALMVRFLRAAAGFDEVDL